MNPIHGFIFGLLLLLLAIIAIPIMALIMLCDWLTRRTAPQHYTTEKRVPHLVHEDPPSVCANCGKMADKGAICCKACKGNLISILEWANLKDDDWS